MIWRPATQCSPRVAIAGRPAALLLAVVLCVSVLSRTLLILSGGQFYWPDEKRYLASRAIVQLMLAGHASQALAQLDDGDHVLFKGIGTIPAIAEAMVGQHPAIPALFFAAFSVVNIFLVWRIARRHGAADSEAFTAAALFAAGNSFFYYTRHLLPYDVAMTFGLLALDCAQSARPHASLRTGFLSGLAFLTYEGYWTLTLAAIVVHGLHQPSVRQSVIRMMLAGAAASLPLVSGAWVSAMLGGHFGPNVIAFAQTIHQGDPREGWHLPIAYLWHAEHTLLLLWMACLGYCVWQWLTGAVPLRVRAAVTAFLVIYALLVASSMALRQFVVYGRLARQLVPFLAITGAYALERLRVAPVRWGGTITVGVAAGVCVQALVNFATPMRLVFPDAFRRESAALVGGLAPGSYEWVNVGHIYPGPTPASLPEPYLLLKERPHPMTFVPYQFEGYTPPQRRTLQATRLTMQLIIADPNIQPTQRVATTQ